MTHPGCDHIGILTPDAEQLASFYTKVLGFERTAESALPKSVMGTIFGLNDECRFLKLHKNGFMIEIFQPLSFRLTERITAAIGINHWGYSVEDRVAFANELRRKGHHLIEVDRDGRSVYFLVDPDGNRIEIRDSKR